LGGGLEKPFQDKGIDVFMPKREVQVAGKTLARPISLVEDSPFTLFSPAAADMLL
jgi:hypothetical protein